MLGQRRVTSGWEDYPVHNRYVILQMGSRDIGRQEERVGWVQ